jgi:hypothetical protein
MMSGIRLNEATKTSYYHSYGSENGFEAEIVLNARDAMVFAQIKQLPDSTSIAVASLNEFTLMLAKEYGAKSTLHMSPELLKRLPEGTLKSTKGIGRYISVETASHAIDIVRSKQHVAAQLNRFATGEYKFLGKDDLRSRAAELSEFKIRYSSFANKSKIEYGQYSEKAEEEKLNNPFVEHYAVEHQGKIIACVMHVLHGNKTYDADFVVHPDYRSRNINPEHLQQEEKNYPHGLAQALCVLVHDHTLEKHPHLTGLWFIAGGYGAKDVGGHLYDDIFPTKILQNDPELQNTVGMFLMFDDPGKELLLAGNRDPKTRLVNADESKYVEAALGILAQSQEPDLAASQPQATVETKKEQVVPISVFTNPDKTPTATPIAAQEQQYQTGVKL